MVRRTWVLILAGLLALAITAAFLAWHVAGNAQEAVAARLSELEDHEDFLNLRLTRTETALAETQGQLKDAQEQLAATQRYLDRAERWAGGLSRWGPLCVLYRNRGSTEIGPPVQDSPWWNYENVDELLFQVRGALLTARDLRQVDPSQDAILSREVVSGPILTTPLEGYQWVGLAFSGAVELRIAGQSVDSTMVLLFFPDAAEEVSVYLQRADGAWLKAVVPYDAKPLQQWIQKLYDDMGPWD